MTDLPTQCPNCGATKTHHDELLVVDGVVVKAKCQVCGAIWDRRKGWRELQRLPRKHDQQMNEFAITELLAPASVTPSSFRKRTLDGLSSLLRSRGIPAKKAYAVALFMWKNGVVIA